MEENERVFDIKGILDRLPHRFPFVMVDRITELTDEKIVGYKNVTFNEWFLQGHFPGAPVVPGVLIIEGMAQAGGIMMIENMKLPKNMLVYFMTIDKVKFRKQVVPGDKLVYEVTALLMSDDSERPKAKFQGKAYVDGKLVAEAIMSALGNKKE